MPTDSAHLLANMAQARSADLRYVSPKIKVLAKKQIEKKKTTPKFLADVDGFMSLPIRVTGNKDKYFRLCCS